MPFPPFLLEGFQRRDRPGFPRRRQEFAGLADPRNGNELVAAVTQGKPVPAPRRNAPLLEQVLQRAARPAGVQAQTLPALPQARGDAHSAQFRETQAASLFGPELQHSAERKNGQGVCAVPDLAQVPVDRLRGAPQVKPFAIPEKRPSRYRKADPSIGSRLPQLAQQLAGSRRRERLDILRVAPIAQQVLGSGSTEAQQIRDIDASRSLAALEVGSRRLIEQFAGFGEVGRGPRDRPARPGKLPLEKRKDGAPQKISSA